MQGLQLLNTVRPVFALSKIELIWTTIHAVSQALPWHSALDSAGPEFLVLNSNPAFIGGGGRASERGLELVKQWMKVYKAEPLNNIMGGFSTADSHNLYVRPYKPNSFKLELFTPSGTIQETPSDLPFEVRVPTCTALVFATKFMFCNLA
eukprot:1194892-Prorocentrum_minimum.AAC.4